MARTKAFDEEAVLDRALNLFWTKGYCSTSLEDLVTGLGISRSSMYDTFTDKHTLYVAALKRYRLQTTEKAITMLMKAHLIMPALEALLEQIITESVGAKNGKKGHQEQCYKGCFIVNSMIEFGINDSEITNVVSLNNEQFVRAIETAIERGQKSGEIVNAQSAQSLAEFVFSTILGIRVMAKSHPTRERLENIVSLTLSCLRSSA